MRLRVAFIQCAISSESPTINSRNLFKQLTLVLKENPDIVLFPEVCLGSTMSKKWHDKFKKVTSDFFCRLQDISNQKRIFFFGSVFQKLNSKGWGNNAFLIGPQQKIQTYQKLHLFKLGQEHKRYIKGRKLKNFNSPWGKIAPLICYDIRFPEMLRKLVFDGATLACVCAQWPKSRRDHWLTLLKARAIENQIYIFACNRVGKKSPLLFSGDSCIISPWGDIELHLNGHQNHGYYDVNINNINKIRNKFPFLKDAQKSKFSFEI